MLCIKISLHGETYLLSPRILHWKNLLWKAHFPMIFKLRASCRFESQHLCRLANTEPAFSQGTVTKLVTGMVFHEYKFSTQCYSLYLLFSSKLNSFFPAWWLNKPPANSPPGLIFHCWVVEAGIETRFYSISTVSQWTWLTTAWSLLT